MKKILRKEALIGLLVILALVILYFGINYLKGVNLFKTANYYYATYNETQGLAISAPVTLNGYKVGVVREINYDFEHPGNITVELSVDKELKLPQGSSADISVDLLGTASVCLKLASGTTYYNVGDTIPGVVNGGMMAALSEQVLPSVGSIMAKVDTLMTNLNTLSGNPALSASITRFDDITLELNASLKQLHSVLAKLGPVAGDVKNITANVDHITGDLAEVSGTLKELPIDTLVYEIQGTLANLHAISDELRNPDSTLGKLTSDPSLYNSVNRAIGSLDSLLVDVKKNPKRYISIKLL